MGQGWDQLVKRNFWSQLGRSLRSLWYMATLSKTAGPVAKQAVPGLALTHPHKPRKAGKPPYPPDQHGPLHQGPQHGAQSPPARCQGAPPCPRSQGWGGWSTHHLLDGGGVSHQGLLGQQGQHQPFDAVRVEAHAHQFSPGCWGCPGVRAVWGGAVVGKVCTARGAPQAGGWAALPSPIPTRLCAFSPLRKLSSPPP